MDWYLVSSQLYFTINLEEIFYFNNKKCRIYAVFGVSQTPICLQTGKEQKMTKQGRLGYNSSNGRYGLLSLDLWIDTGFHCGERLEVLMDDEWVQIRCS